ncbi:bacillithiol biosynthesis cysteine-adding enzyme BshC [Ilyomonas limi]|uniref:Putative cysteine ligase BshC n=1 Tax=Ilyomonas limi TaxID=2575867 RepID=A0A4U3KVA0_9BACT|nr:bacillithiol biosynthesis cysteine-adding enzyme BshC [Ilyomonas limi]TKK64947.1 bacillithiol biosynthesis cysteine-adding enzyme BshC [Ilyomonas limi]
MDCTYLPYQQTGYFSKLITDYLQQNEALQPFYEHEVSLDGIRTAIQQRQAFSQNRQVLADVLKQQYAGIEIDPAVEKNIQSLLQSNTFTITTAHQPVIFTGPLYFVYKILHVIKIAESLHKQLPEYHFVPVFFMGSEDADLDELGTINVDGKQYKWNTTQTGAVGRMKVDKAFIALLNELSNQISVEKFGKEIIALFRQCYKLNTTIQQATLELVNALFGEYGLIVLIPDNRQLKNLFAPVIEKELTEQFSHAAVAATIDALSQQYKAQAGGREINMFYLIDDKRERIEKEGDAFVVQAINKTFTKEELLQELQTAAERFSPNVILRGALQETILPNIAFVGGGGELAYWMELKQVFKAIHLPYPMLILRNSFLFINEKQATRTQELGFAVTDLFQSAQTLINELVKRNAGKQLTLTDEIACLQKLYSEKLTNIIDIINITLHAHVLNLGRQAQKGLIELEKKMLRAEKKKYEAQQRQINKLKAQLFPDNSLQERVENLSLFYARYGNEFIKIAYQYSLALEQEFAIVQL